MPVHAGDVTATIDWCENNYETTEYVVEFWNAVSSFVVCVGGVLHLYHAAQYKYELRYQLQALGIIVVGLGSAA